MQKQRLKSDLLDCILIIFVGYSAGSVRMGLISTLPGHLGVVYHVCSLSLGGFQFGEGLSQGAGGGAPLRWGPRGSGGNYGSLLVFGVRVGTGGKGGGRQPGGKRIYGEGVVAVTRRCVPTAL